MATLNIYEEIKHNYPDMNDQEVEIEFLTQMWIASMQKQVDIHKRGDEHTTIYSFTGIHISPLPKGEHIHPDQFFAEKLGLLLIEAVKEGYIFIVNSNHIVGESKDGKQNLSIVNSHDMEEGGYDHFIYALSDKEAIEYIQSMIDE